MWCGQPLIITLNQGLEILSFRSLAPLCVPATNLKSSPSCLMKVLESKNWQNVRFVIFSAFDPEAENIEGHSPTMIAPRGPSFSATLSEQLLKFCPQINRDGSSDPAFVKKMYTSLPVAYAREIMAYFAHCVCFHNKPWMSRPLWLSPMPQFLSATQWHISLCLSALTISKTSCTSTIDSVFVAMKTTWEKRDNTPTLPAGTGEWGGVLHTDPLCQTKSKILTY